MKAIFNSRIINESESFISVTNRAFCYGDGLFETIVTAPGRIDLISSHLNRLKRGCEILGMNLPNSFTEANLRAYIQSLRDLNELGPQVRIKIIVWRNQGGLYAPEKDSASYYIECKNSQKSFIRKAQQIGVCKNYHTQFSPISFAKTTNALPYVLAGKEMKAKDWDEIIMTDGENHLAETHLSNLFWKKENLLFTPSLKSGCVEGIMRQAFIQACQKCQVKVREVLVDATEILQADSIFSTNASGFTYFEQIGSRILEDPLPYIESPLKQLQRL